ncbi:MAG: hypothetical protein IT210_19160 [Armatimonadetes bacterium]|nr:hypothetical protein [Armatimonadota bacterium]
MWPSAPPKTHLAIGLHDNLLIVVPEWNMVIARTNGQRPDGSANTPGNRDELWSRFLALLGEGIADR